MPKADWGGGVGGAASGASAGFTVGGPWGAAIGGTLGFFGGAFGGKKKKKPKQISTLDKNQQALNDSQHKGIMGEGPLADLYNYNPEQANNVFDQTIANPAWRDFAEKGAPTITGSFRGQGLQNSSYVGDSLAREGRNIQENLQGQRSKYQFDLGQDARNAKRNAVENIQNRQNFAVDQSGNNNSGGGNWMDNILKSVSGNPEASGALQDMALKYLPGGV